MADEAFIEVCALNIDAAEHPPGTYIRVLNLASAKSVRARGSDFAKITKPRRLTEDVYVGRILVWTDINLQGRWLDIESEDDLGDDVRDRIVIPEQAKPNYRTFDYVFKVDRHRLYFEVNNVLRQKLGVTTALKIFRLLLSREVLGPNVPEIEVTILPEATALDKVLQLPGLRSLFIKVLRPNPDTSSPAARKRVLERLKAASAQKLEETWSKSADAPSLNPSPEIIETAGVAAEVGLVSGIGRDVDGKPNEASTQSFPQRFRLGENSGETLVDKLRTTLRTRF